MLNTLQFYLKRLFCIALLLGCLTLIGCDFTPKHSGVGNSVHINVVPDTSAEAISLPIIGQACIDISSSYSPAYISYTEQKVALWIDQLVRPAQAGATIYIQWIDDDTIAPQSTAMVITVPALPADPVHSTAVLANAASTSNNPFDAPTATAQAIYAQTALSERQKQLDEQYKQALQAHEVLIAQARVYVKRETDELRSLKPAIENVSSDIAGCLQVASDRFNKVSGKKFLIIASDLERTGTQQITSKHQLPGVKVVVMDFPCTDANACLENETYWQGTFQQAHVASVQFYDPAESETLNNVFLN